jgi:hypothetical protein
MPRLIHENTPLLSEIPASWVDFFNPITSSLKYVVDVLRDAATDDCHSESPSSPPWTWGETGFKAVQCVALLGCAGAGLIAGVLTEGFFKENAVPFVLLPVLTLAQAGARTCSLRSVSEEPPERNLTQAQARVLAAQNVQDFRTQAKTRAVIGAGMGLVLGAGGIWASKQQEIVYAMTMAIGSTIGGSFAYALEVAADRESFLARLFRLKNEERSQENAVRV